MRYVVMLLALAVAALAIFTALGRDDATVAPPAGTEAGDEKDGETLPPPPPLEEVVGDLVEELVDAAPDDGFRDRALADLVRSAANDDEDAKTIRPALAESLDELIAEAARHRLADGAAPKKSARKLAILRVARDFTSLIGSRVTIARGNANLVHEGKVLPAVSLASAPPRAGHERVAWQRLTSFSHAAGDAIPADVGGLDGREVTVVGYVLAGEAQAALTEFLLVESSWTCCFGPPPAVTHVVVVEMAEGVTPPREPNIPVALHGRISVGEEREDGHVTSLYRMTATEAVHLD